MDGITPDCEVGRGCLIPALLPAGARAMQIRSMLGTLHDVVDAGSILQLYQADFDDLALLAVIEDELREAKPHGEGR